MSETTTESITTKRRGSIHKNLYDDSLFQLPNANDISKMGLYNEYRNIPRHINHNHHRYRSQKTTTSRSYRNGLFNIEIPDLKSIKARQFIPEIDIKITILCLAWYITSSISSNLSKAILKGFKHPVALTELQFLISATLCIMFVSLLNLNEKFKKSADFNHRKLTCLNKIIDKFPEMIIPKYLNGSFQDSIINTFLKPNQIVIMTVFPMGLFQFVGHITSHNATALVPISIVHSVKALSPIATVGYYYFIKGGKKRADYNEYTFLTLSILIFGVIVTCWFTHNNTKKTNGAKTVISSSSLILGLIYSCISMIIFVAQNIFAKEMFNKKSNSYSTSHKKEYLPSTSIEHSATHTATKHIDKITILFYCSTIGFILTFIPFITGELIKKNNSVFHDLTLHILQLAIIHGVAHFIQALFAFQLIALLSSVNYSVANILKRIVIILVALSWESHVNWGQFLGLTFTLIGLYGYDKYGLVRL
ncbi:Sly41p NDAI_0E00570 [Naumovozyma dairenensis CBS 421]|uniref:Sugar phosphate transporter domain-containing protein n=1 Tax=Naumovozyma dairenensis (strain ATCC 10597 / BCRC 20456 / CBS 421 / NBRC 0211 / NRRL Y-12639) TaxID=1071378 RepID=G0WAV3_NAUDC|nr:hypothetical protein NDAI_0E00570 [Naumovozyma dairenensis CBS 421]CCD24873.1 hypothetical protein NDAI_0E00570 [Naumovozyma dairenensis CBS 421]